ncbi:hypothetical protein LUW77_24430 [Streptomyces radiopugnans]|nr:hypothetical protein LUW77_24430 [Streptomyces radiopugnans]
MFSASADQEYPAASTREAIVEPSGPTWESTPRSAMVPAQVRAARASLSSAVSG